VNNADVRNVFSKLTPEINADGAYSTQSVSKTTDIAAHDGFTTVTRKKRGRIAEDFHSLPTVPVKTHKATVIGVRSSSSLPIVARKTQSKALFSPYISPPRVTASDIEKSLKEQLKLLRLSALG
jgi:hypothetical protein